MPCWKSSAKNITQQKKLVRLPHSILQVLVDLAVEPTSPWLPLRCPMQSLWACITAFEALHHLYVGSISSQELRIRPSRLRMPNPQQNLKLLLGRNCVALRERFLASHHPHWVLGCLLCVFLYHYVVYSWLWRRFSSQKYLCPSLCDHHEITTLL